MNDERDRRAPMPSGWQQGGYRPSAPPNDPIDMREVHFDDAFIDALSRDLATPTRDPAEYELAMMLSGWRAEASAVPAPPLPALDEVERAMFAEAPSRRGGRVVRTLRIVSGAAAIAIVAAAGLTVVSQGSQPGDPLWGVKKVVFSEAASQTQAAYDVRSDLEQAEAALAAGHTDEAHQLIARAQSKMGPVSDAGTREQMDQWIHRLRADDTAGPTTLRSSSNSAVRPAPPVDATSTAPTSASNTSAPTSQPPVSTPSPSTSTSETTPTTSVPTVAPTTSPASTPVTTTTPEPN